MWQYQIFRSEDLEDINSILKEQPRFGWRAVSMFWDTDAYVLMMEKAK